MLTQWRVDLCCLQETRWEGWSVCLFKGNNTIYKFFWYGDQSGFGGVGMLAEKWVKYVISVKRYDHCCLQLCFNCVISVKRYDHCCLQLCFMVGKTILNVICCYALEKKDTWGEGSILWRGFNMFRLYQKRC